jgi:hypothetical protein
MPAEVITELITDEVAAEAVTALAFAAVGAAAAEVVETAPPAVDHKAAEPDDVTDGPEAAIAEPPEDHVVVEVPASELEVTDDSYDAADLAELDEVGTSPAGEPASL